MVNNKSLLDIVYNVKTVDINCSQTIMATGTTNIAECTNCVLGVFIFLQDLFNVHTFWKHCLIMSVDPRSFPVPPQSISHYHIHIIQHFVVSNNSVDCSILKFSKPSSSLDLPNSDFIMCMKTTWTIICKHTKFNHTLFAKHTGWLYIYICIAGSV